ncbi:hypothetical protein SK128_022269 [Halocaridina rubra]|uniref:G-protein coupled receptors family 1 profile domain-containing protein n=1 Tax=Halocaridina rubra TaxID=373956 RepID=A0AAN8XBL8_HALRR
MSGTYNASHSRLRSDEFWGTCNPVLFGNGTSTNEADKDDLLDEEKFVSQMETLTIIAYQYVLPILVSLAILTNLMNILMLWKVRQQQKQQQRHAQATTYCYLMWLAITDMLASLSLIPALLHLERKELSYGWAYYYAHFEISVINALTSASVYIVVGLSVDRFIAVCHPRRYRTVSAPRLAVFRIALSLIIPIFIYMPHFFYQEVVCANTGMGWTYKNNEAIIGDSWYVWEVIVELCHRMIPATILAILNLCIIITFKKVTERRKSITNNKDVITPNEHSSEGKHEESARNQQERRLVNLLVAIVTTFLLTHLPAAVLALNDTAGTNLGSFNHEVFRAVANCLEVFGFSLNFVLYFFFVNGMRQVLIDAMSLVKKKVCGLAIHTKVTRGCSNSSDNNTKGSDTKNTDCVEL